MEGCTFTEEKQEEIDVPAARAEQVEHVDEWRKKMETLVQRFVQDCDARKESMTAQTNEIRRVVYTMEQMVVLMTINQNLQR